MSSEMKVGILQAEYPRFPGEGSSTQGKSGPKPRTEVVGDGQQVQIPAPPYARTAGTREGKRSRGWRTRCKRRKPGRGKSFSHKAEDVKRSEKK